MKPLRVLFCLSLLTSSLSIASWAGAFNYTNGLEMRGRIKNPDGAPATGVKVSVRDEYSANNLSSTVTDQSGNFKLPLNLDNTTPVCSSPLACIGNAGLVPSTYILTIEAPGYPKFERRTNVSQTGIGVEVITLSKTAAAATQASPEAQKELGAGKQALDANRSGDAVQHLQKAIAADADYAEAYQLLGVAQLAANNLANAEAAEVKAIALNPDLINAHFVLALVKNLRGDRPAARESLVRFLALTPSNAAGHFELARTEFALGHFAEAELHARKAVELDHSNAAAYIVLGYALLRQQHGRDAMEAFDDFLKLQPAATVSPDIRETIAMIQQHEGARNN